MEINGVTIDNTYAEAFPTWVCRIIITAVTKEWARKQQPKQPGLQHPQSAAPAKQALRVIFRQRDSRRKAGRCNPDLCKQEETQGTGS